MEADFLTLKGDDILRYHSAELDRYLKLKSLGKSSMAALAGAFDHEYCSSMNSQFIINLIETNDHYLNALPAYIEKFKSHAVWSPEISARVLASIATDESAKKSDRIAAAKELNVIYNITIIDEKGNTRAGRSLDDFYADVGIRRTQGNHGAH
jgi:hypothetical protein